MTYATVCSGIECMSVACRGLPLRPVFFSEIEPFPCAVLKAHYPDVPNLGDMSKIQVSQDGKEITNGTINIRLDTRLDILAGGTPCQDVSVAGKRAGMQEGSGTRSSLAFDFVRLARELRPRWVLWENVAGSIDSKNAPDFLRFVGALGDCGYTIAWRVLDAQYVRVDGMERAVPQRRRRVWVVGCLGADESIPAQILFEPDCVAGHTAPRRRAGEGFAYSLAGRDRVDAGVVGEPAARGFRSGSFGQFVNDETYGTLYCKHMNSAANGTPAFAVHDAIALEGNGQRQSHKGTGVKAKRTWWNGSDVATTTTTTTGHNQLMPDKDRFDAVVECRDVAETIDSNYYKGQGSRQGVERPVAVQCYDMTHADDPGRKVADGVSPTLQSRMGTGGNQVPLAVSTNSNGEDVAPTILSCEYKMGQRQKDTGEGTSSPAARKEHTMSHNFELYDNADEVSISLSACRASDTLVVKAKEGSEGE